MQKGKERKMSMALLVIAIFAGMAFCGILVPGNVMGDTIWDDHLVSSASSDPTWAYSTSTVDVDISYSLAPVPSSMELSNLTITVVEVDSGVLPTMLYSWNLTADGDMPVNPFTWELDGTQTVGNWKINVTADYYNGTSGDNHKGSGEVHFQVIEGVHMIRDISASPETVTNSGMDTVNMTFMFNRTFDEVDNTNTTAAFYHVDSDSWVAHEDLNIPEPSPENMTEGTHNVSAWSHMPIPEDLTVGEYKLYFNLFDIYGYNESINETMFNVIWKEMPPEMVNDTVYMHEDDFAVVDLDDHFMDVNHQELMYYINTSAVENLTITWEDEDENIINITPDENFDEEQTFELNVTDGIDMPGHNLSFTMIAHVMPTEDPLMTTDDLTVLIHEDVAMADFDPQEFFYDPDGPVDFIVSLGWEWAVNETNVSYQKPIWTWENENFSVIINETDNSDGMAEMVADLEEGSAEFPISAWMNGTPELNATAMVEIVPVNDIPAPVDDTIQLYMNEAQTFNMSALFVDPDSTDLNFSVNSSMTENLDVEYDWETMELTLTPAVNWTDSTEFNVTATDGIDEKEYTMKVEVILRSYVVSGSVEFEEVDGVDVNLSNVTLMIGETEVELNETGAFEITLEQGDYDVTMTVPEELLYSQEDMRSGYQIPDLPALNLTSDQDYPVAVAYMVYEEPMDEASWDDLDFEDGVEFQDDDDLTVTLGVKEGTEDHDGWDSFVVKLVILDSDEEVFGKFNMTWNGTDSRFSIVLSDDDLDDLGDGKKEYYFTNEDESEQSATEKYEFKSEPDSAGPMTIIILVALILLVLVALIFIMKKPSDEDFDEDEEEEEEGRTCPGCGEIVTDDEADECPYCGEDLEEE